MKPVDIVVARASYTGAPTTVRTMTTTIDTVRYVRAPQQRCTAKPSVLPTGPRYNISRIHARRHCWHRGTNVGASLALHPVQSKHPFYVTFVCLDMRILNSRSSTVLLGFVRIFAFVRMSIAHEHWAKNVVLACNLLNVSVALQKLEVS